MLGYHRLVVRRLAGGVCPAAILAAIFLRHPGLLILRHHLRLLLWHHHLLLLFLWYLLRLHRHLRQWGGRPATNQPAGIHVVWV